MNKHIFFAGITFIFPLVLLYAYSNSDTKWNLFSYEVKKMNGESQSISDGIPDIKIDKIKPIEFHTEVISEKKTGINVLTSSVKNDTIKGIATVDFIPDTTFRSGKQRILLLGDSECGGICYPLYNYCKENNHELVLSFVWNSSGIFNHAYSDTVVKIIEKYKPTYIIFVAGLNEIFARDITKRSHAAQVFAQRIKNIPYAWVGPANYVEDYGINKAFSAAAQPGTFFSSKTLNLPKGPDNKHPSSKGYTVWMDTLATWMTKSSKYPIDFSKKPTKKYNYKGKIITLNAAKFKGY